MYSKRDTGKGVDRLETAVRGDLCCGITAPQRSQRDCKNGSWEQDSRLSASGYCNIRKGSYMKIFRKGEDLWLQGRGQEKTKDEISPQVTALAVRLTALQFGSKQLTMSTCSPESQPYPRPHKKKLGQQVERGGTELRTPDTRGA